MSLRQNLGEGDQRRLADKQETRFRPLNTPGACTHLIWRDLGLGKYSMTHP